MNELPVPTITIEVHKGENRAHFNAIEKAAFKSPSFEKKIRTKEHFVHLLMLADDFKSLNADPSKESQLSKLCSFLSACCDALWESIR